MDKVNILYLHSHDCGRFIQPYGYAIPAKKIQRLAEEGVLFRQAFCTTPTCSPSRAGLLSGQWPHCCGMFGLASQSWGYTLNNYEQHLARTMQRNGYQTALSGVQHVARKPWHDPHDMGYDRLLNYADGHDRPDNARTILEAVKFLSEEHDRPFFLSVGFEEPHRSGNGVTFCYDIKPEDAETDGRYCRPMPLHPDTSVTRREMKNFQVGVDVLNQKMGAILDALEENNLADNTLVVCTTDHGPGFPDMKCTLSDWGTGVMLIMRGPGAFNGGKVVDGMVSHLDIYPTLCELTGIEKPDFLQGKSVVPLVEGRSEQIHDAIFTEQNYHGTYRPLRAVRTERYKYIRCYRTEANKSVDAGPTEHMLVEHGWTDRLPAEEALHDLIFDPNEACNVANDPRYTDILTEMRGRLETWLEETNDPILTDAIPDPPAWSCPEWEDRRQER